MGVLDGKSVIVTGAARGIGRECALLAAQEGASVVVNDLGGGMAGDDSGEADPAAQVAQAIRETGGKAVSNSDSVALMSGAKSMFEQAMDEFGGLHAVINPAGILRDVMFHKMDEADWDAVIEVHLKGSFNMARATIEHFRNQDDGAYVMFTSTSGLIGNVGQANYSAAKMGIVGLSSIIAMEGARKNVRSNCIAPFAWTRMIASIPVKDEASAERVERMKRSTRADQIAPPAIALCADEKTNGQIFTVRGNEVFLMSQPRPVRGMSNVNGWSADDLMARGFRAMEADFTDPTQASAGVFTWDPV